MASAYFPIGTEIQLGLVPHAHGTGGQPQCKEGFSQLLYIYLFKLEAPSPRSSGIDCEMLILLRVREDGEREGERRAKAKDLLGGEPWTRPIGCHGDGWAEM